MIIIIEGDKNDFPNEAMKDPKFREAVINSVRKRLELRSTDKVILKIVE